MNKILNVLIDEFNHELSLGGLITFRMEVEFLVKRSPTSEKEIRRFYKKPSNRQRIEDDLIERKVLEHLEQYAKVKEVDVNTKDLRGENK